MGARVLELTEPPGSAGPTAEQPAARLGTAKGRWVLAATIVASGLAMIDATVVTLALPRMGRDLGASFTQLQWIINGYTLTLSALILLGGSLGDLYGRRRIFLLGTIWFAVASLVCALSVNAGMLIGARALQGVGGALLTPGSLAIISSVFAEEDRAKAIGLWSGLGGIAAASAPFLGGWLVEASWRLVFVINLPLSAAVVAIALRHVPESAAGGETKDAGEGNARRRVDWAGTLTGALGLGGLTFALTSAGGASGAGSTATAAGLVVAVVGFGWFVLAERRAANPLVPFGLFTDRVFSLTNLATLFIYAALSVFGFLASLQLQVVSGYSPLQAGIATLPMTLVLLLLSPTAGLIGERLGPRIPMTGGAVLCAAGFVLSTRIGPDPAYLRDVLPGVLVLGIGLTLVVAPLTSAVLAAAPDQLTGTASGINNAVARTAGLLAVAVVPVAAGLAGYEDPVAFDAGYQRGMLIGASLMILGAVASVLLPRGAMADVTRSPSGGPEGP